MIHTHAIAAALLTLTLGISPQIAAQSDLMGQQVAALQFHDTVLLQNTVHTPVTGT